MRLLVLAGVSAVLCAADWPRFRGPNGAGIGDGAPLPQSFGKPVWRAEVPQGLSSPVIAGGRLFVTALDGDQLATLALDPRTGSVLWRRTLIRSRAEKLHKLNHAASPSVAAGGDTAVVFFPDFGLVAYTFGGQERWRRPLGPFQNMYGMGASPVIAGEKVILICDQSSGSFAAAFSLRDGKEIWRTPRKEAISGHATPILHKRWILAPGSFRMEAYDVETGKVTWAVDGLPGEMKSVPVVDQGLVFVHGFNTPENDAGRLLSIAPFAEVLKPADANGDGRLSASEAPTPHARGNFVYLDLNGDGLLDEAEWEQYRKTMRAENALLAYRIGAAGGPVWRFLRSIPQLPSPLVYRGVLYMVNEGGVLTTLDAATGKLHKQARLRGEADRYYASPVAGDGKIYVASHTGTISVLRAGPEQELLHVNKLDEEILATPALVDGRIYLRTKSAVYCFGSAP